MYKILLLIPSFYLAQTSGNIGINTMTPSATLDIVGNANTATTKALRVSNSNNVELLTIQNNGNIGINSAISTNNNAQLTINSGGAATNSVLKILNLSSTNNKENSLLNYNQYSPLVVDNNGHVFKQYDIRTTSTTSSTFDGTYTATPSAKQLIQLNGGSVVRFTLLTPDFTLGNGDILYADITWTRNGGFRVNDYGHENLTGTNPLTVLGAGTNTLTFDFLTGKDLVISTTLTGNTGAGSNLGIMQYNITGAGDSAFEIFSSFRSR